LGVGSEDLISLPKTLAVYPLKQFGKKVSRR